MTINKKKVYYVHIAVKPMIRDRLTSMNLNNKLPFTQLMDMITRFIIKNKKEWEAYYMEKINLFLKEEEPNE